MSTLYNIYLDDEFIGTTYLEKADAPMGVVFGEIEFVEEGGFGYSFFKTYCLQRGILIQDDPTEEFILTQKIESLKVKSENGYEIKGIGNHLSGIKGAPFEIYIPGIAYPFYEEEFPHHVKAYEAMFQEKG